MQPKILIIEDDQLTLHMLEYMLTKRGFDVTGIADSRTLNKAEHIEKADAIVIDINLPFIGGDEIMDTVKALYPGKKIVLTSAQKALDSYKGTNADMLLAKPYNSASINALTTFLKSA